MKKLLVVALLGTLVGVVALAVVLYLRSSAHPSTLAGAPQNVTISKSPPADVHALPSPPYASLIAHPDRPGVEGAHFAPDAQRAVDLAAIQVSLERYHAYAGSYPTSMDALLPDFPVVEMGQPSRSIPVDPVTHQPYVYRRLDPGHYLLTAVLSAGKPLTLPNP